MSRLAGIHRRDLTAVPMEDRLRLSGWLANARTRLQVHEEPSVFLAGACMLNRSVPESSVVQSHAGVVIGWDGRLDHRGDLLKRLGSRLHDDQTDPAIVLALYECWGAEALRDLVGDWSFVIWDRRTRCLLLASDYAGVRPLYYRQSPESVEWSSSIADLADSSPDGDLDRDYVAEFLLRGASRHRTPYAGVRAVPPGHIVCICREKVSVQPFWKLEPASPVCYEHLSEYEEQFQVLFRQAVEARLRSAGPVHSELSGGMDSSAIVAMGQKLIQDGSALAPELVSVSYCHPSSNDEPFFRLMERHCGLRSIHLQTDDYPYLSAGSPGDGLPAWWTARQVELSRRLTAEGSSVLLTGQLGDLITGNWLDDSDQVADQIRRGAIVTALEQAFGWSQTLHVPVYSVLWRAIRMNLAWHSDTIPLGGETSVRGDSSDSLTPELKERVTRLSSEAAPGRWREAPPGQRKLFRALAGMLEDRRLQTPEALRPVCYTHPFADRRLVEFMLSIPSEVVCSPGEPRRLMRRALNGVLPAAILNRRSKATFNTVFRRALQPLAVKLLRSPQLLISEYGYVDPADLSHRLNRFLNGLACNESHLKHAILLEYWLRQRAGLPSSQERREYLRLSAVS